MRIALPPGSRIAVSGRQARRNATPPGTISGTVFATGTNAPMKDVEVYVNRGAATGAQTLTDVLGHYVLKNVTPGQVRISVVAPDSSGRRGGFGPTSDRRRTLAPARTWPMWIST